MFGTVLRLIWRVFIGTVAILLAHGTAFLLYPYLRARFPLFVTLMVLYIFAAYFGIPALVRLWRLVIRPQHLPHYAVTRDGWSSDPVNIAIVCKSEAELRSAMEEAGWAIADKPTLKNSLKEAIAIIFKKSYPTAPFSSLFYLAADKTLAFKFKPARSLRRAIVIMFGFGS